MNGQVVHNPFTPAFRASTAVFGFFVVASFCLVIPAFNILAALMGVAFLWVVIRHPIFVLGALLAFMPFDYLAIELGKFLGLPHMTLVSACTKEVPLLLLILVLWWRNGFKSVAADWFLLACLLIATMRTVFDGSWAAFAIDFSFVVPYFVGRMTGLSGDQERKWVVRGVWIVGVIAVLGLIEVFFLGPAPRTALYLSTDASTLDGALGPSFHAIGFAGLREAATMTGPNSFGALCMVALILWWVYCRNLMAAVMIATGLVCSVTRSAWLGIVMAIPLLGIVMNQKKRLLGYTILAVAATAIAVPLLGLTDYVFFNKTGQDPSAEYHWQQIPEGMRFAVDHPLGAGNQKTSPLLSEQQSDVTPFETTYPELAAGYGFPALVCFLGFLGSAFYACWRNRSAISYASMGILIGMGAVMLVTLPLADRRLSCWALFPIGLAVRSAMPSEARLASARIAVSEQGGLV
jgi:hypothetical protein